jgi:DNA topoisomerase I
LATAAKPKTKGKNLVIVESPAKAKTINRYLGKGFEVMASMGHVRDLPSKNISVDVEHAFSPTYEIIPSRRKTVSSLKKIAKDSETVFLATDLDREGEAIAWHLTEALGLRPDQIQRVVFNAITKAAIENAFSHPRPLDIDKVNAQQARRILDRIVGYEISPLLWKKVARGLSAGRVQSVAVKLIVLREREIQAFVPEEYWKLTAVFSVKNDKSLPGQWQAFLSSFSDKPAIASEKMQWLAEHDSFNAILMMVGKDHFRPNNQADADRVFQSLQGRQFSVTDIKTRTTRSAPSAPFITSTLQQQAATRLSFSTQRTMIVAQQLYEGVELSGQGSVGLITYMRTDSTHLAPEAVQAARDFILNTFGQDYCPEKPNVYASSNKSAQQAHEAIRPTDVNLTPQQVQKDLSPEQFKLYQLIWNRFVASQMTPAQWDVTSIQIEAPTSLGQAVFKANGRKLAFDGFTRVMGISFSGDEQVLPAVAVGSNVWPIQLERNQHFTSPPPRYTEASLVKTLEAEGIGRPSTYASIIGTIQERGYVEQIDRKFHATDLGIVVTDKLNDHFPQLMDIAFTRLMEGRLDQIEEQHIDWVQVLQEFYGPFKDTLNHAHDEMTHAKAETQPSEYSCPKCEKPLVYRFGKNGRFLSCSNYPECKYAAPCDRQGQIVEAITTEHRCPQCNKEMILRKGRFGTFLGCSGYPECKTTLKLDKQGNPLPPKPPPEPSGVKCYKCKEGQLLIRQSKRGPFLGCSRYPRCRVIISMKQIDQLKQWQAEGLWPPADIAKADEMLGRKKDAKADKDQPDEAKSRPKTRKAKPTPIPPNPDRS